MSRPSAHGCAARSSAQRECSRTRASSHGRPRPSSRQSARSWSGIAVSSTRSRTEELEAIGYEVWLAPEVEELDGWRMRFAHGLTGRANSVWPNGDGVLPLDEKIERAEEWYRERGAPALFQVTSVARPPELDTALVARGYVTRVAPVSVQAARLDVVVGRTGGDA